MPGNWQARCRSPAAALIPHARIMLGKSRKQVSTTHNRNLDRSHHAPNGLHGNCPCDLRTPNVTALSHFTAPSFSKVVMLGDAGLYFHLCLYARCLPTNILTCSPTNIHSGPFEGSLGCTRRLHATSGRRVQAFELSTPWENDFKCDHFQPLCRRDGKETEGTKNGKETNNHRKATAPFKRQPAKPQQQPQ